jgi:CheY-like chemotaxis protein
MPPDSGAVPGGGAPRRAAPVRILLAEDDPTNQYVFRAILQAAGYEVEIAENGLVALERGRRFPPDLILLDMMMPVMDGYEAAAQFSQDPCFDGIAVVALTAKAMQGDLEKTLEAGCDDYISKPVSRGLLLERIRYWLARPQEEWMPRRLSRRRLRAS